MKRLGLDLDGCVYDWHIAVYHELRIYEGLNISLYDFWKEKYKTHRNKMYWDNLVQFRHLYSNQAPSKELLEVLNKLSKKYTFYYITNRPKDIFDTTKNWLKRFKLPYQNNLIFTEDKVSVCNSVGVSYMVEDREHNIIDLVNSGIKVIAIKQPYNEDFLNSRKDFIVLNSILELGDIL